MLLQKVISKCIFNLIQRITYGMTMMEKMVLENFAYF